jgi:hypothetical protein
MAMPAIAPPPKLEGSLLPTLDADSVDVAVTDWLCCTMGTVMDAVVDEDAVPDVVAVLDALEEDEEPKAAICDGIRSRFT